MATRISLCYDLSVILQYLHSLDPKTHEDAKPENILVSDKDLYSEAPSTTVCLLVFLFYKVDENLKVHLCDFGDSEESDEGNFSEEKLRAGGGGNKHDVYSSSYECEVAMKVK